MPDESAESLLASARELEARAIRSGEDEPDGRELRGRAAELRRQALGAKAYPVLRCSSCLRVTGWLAADGRCDSCLRRAQLEAAYSDPHGGWVTLADTRAPDEERPEPPPLAARIAALLGRRESLDRAVSVAWLEHVDPDTNGPVEPFSAGLSMEQLAEAWADWQGAVETFNRATWQSQSGARETERRARDAHETALDEQWHVSELLDDGR